MCTLIGQTLAAGIILACGTPGAWKTETADGTITLFYERQKIAPGTRAFSLSCDPASGAVRFVTHVKTERRKSPPRVVTMEGGGKSVRFTLDETRAGPDGLAELRAKPLPAAEVLKAFEKGKPVKILAAGRSESIPPLEAEAMRALEAFRAGCGLVPA